MKFLYSITFVSLIITASSCFTVKSNAHFSYQKLTPLDYATFLKDSSNYYLIDVRTKNEYNKAHVTNAVNYSFLAFHFGKDVDSLNHNKLVFLYCQTCHRSPIAARTLKRKGFRKVYDLKGGYSKWPTVN